MAPEVILSIASRRFLSINSCSYPGYGFRVCGNIIKENEWRGYETTEANVTEQTSQIEKLRASLAALEAQRAILGEVIEPAIAATRQQLAALEALERKQSAPAEERRLVTILFTDIVDSTSIASRLDPEEWRQILSAVHSTVGDLIAQNGGRVAQYLGDGLLAFFGADRVVEHDPENAIRAALEIQLQVAGHRSQVTGDKSQIVGQMEREAGDLLPGTDGLPPATCDLQLRIGIHTGLVVVGELGAESHKEFTATGDAMNLASRLQSAAPPGGILISHDTYRYVRGVFDFTPRPPLVVKGKPQPIRTYLVRRAKPRAFRTVTRGVEGIDTPTVGRDDEIHLLKAAYLDAYENRRVVWIQLIGEAGIGKTRLLQDVREWIDLRDELVRVFRARAYASDRGQAHALVRRLFFDRFQIAEDAPLAEAEAAWVARFREFCGIEEVEPAHALGLLVGLPFSGSPYIGAMRHDPQQVKGRAFAVSREFFNAVRRTMPIEMMLEDLHWADAASEEWLSEVVLCQDQASSVGDSSQSGFFIMATARPEWQPPAVLKPALQLPVSTLASQPPERSIVGSSVIARILTVPPLSDIATRELAHALLRRVASVPDDVFDLIVKHSEGIPYYAEELVNWFVDRGIIDKTVQPWRFDALVLHESPLPATLQHLLLTRLSALSEEERAVLQRGAIFGRNFWVGGLEALGIRSGVQLLGELEPRGLVQVQPESSLAGESEWSFIQTLLREVTYESILKRERGKLHRAAAGWLEEQARQAGRLDEFAGLIAEHYERAGEASIAADWYLQAGEAARITSALSGARRLFERALELLPPLDHERRWRACLGREAVEDMQGDRSAQQTDLDTLKELAETFDDDERRALANFREMMYLRATGDWQGVKAVAEVVVNTARRAGNAGLEVRALAARFMALPRLGENPAGLYEEVLARAEAAGDDSVLAFTVNRVGAFHGEIGDLAQAVALLSRGAEIARRAGDRIEQCLALTNLGMFYVQLGQYRLARASLEEAMTLEKAIGERRYYAYAVGNLGEVYMRLGDNLTARRMVQEALAEFRAMGDVYAQAGTLLQLARIDAQAGDYDAAHERYLQAVNISHRVGDQGLVNEATAGLAQCAVTLGGLDQAREHSVVAWNYICSHEKPAMQYPSFVYVSLADVFDALGKAADSRAIIETGYRELQAAAARISNGEWRQQFLENVEENRMLVELWQRMQYRLICPSHQHSPNTNFAIAPAIS